MSAFYGSDLTHLHNIYKQVAIDSKDKTVNMQSAFNRLIKETKNFLNYYDNIDCIREPSSNKIRLTLRRLAKGDSLSTIDSKSKSNVQVGFIDYNKALNTLKKMHINNDITSRMNRSIDTGVTYVDRKPTSNNYNIYDYAIPLDRKTVYTIATTLDNVVDSILSGSKTRN